VLPHVSGTICHYVSGPLIVTRGAALGAYRFRLALAYGRIWRLRPILWRPPDKILASSTRKALRLARELMHDGLGFLGQ